VLEALKCDVDYKQRIGELRGESESSVNREAQEMGGHLDNSDFENGSNYTSCLWSSI
jgi:hypothetical protein